MWIYANIPTKSMRLMVKVVWTFKKWSQGSCSYQLNFVVFIFFAVWQSTGTMYTKNECPHLKNIYIELWKEGSTS